MRVLTVRLEIQAEALQEFTVARDKVLTALEEKQPKGIRYTWCAGAEKTSFVGLVEVEDGVENPLPGMEAGKEFLANLQHWVAAPPVREALTVIGTYSSPAKE